MKRVIKSLILVGALFFVVQANDAHAHVVDETKVKSAQSDYEQYYQLIATYKGESGVTIKSYSSEWGTTAKLKELEQELRQNKYGKEISLLKEVIIFPNAPAGKGVLGQYFAEYELNRKQLLPGRKIHLYNGNTNETVESLALTLSHEYGHHFTFYHLLNSERLLPDEWLKSDYAKVRELAQYPKANVGDGEYIWMLAELLAEDYVQLFGSEKALSQHMQMNAQLPTAFETSGMQAYWQNYVSSPEYTIQTPIALNLIDYRPNSVNSRYVDLQLFYQNLQSKQAYLVGQDYEGRYAPLSLGSVTGGTSSEQWLNQSDLHTNRWLVDKTSIDQVSVQAVQHSERGFNRGSSKLSLSYQNLNLAKRSKEELIQEEENRAYYAGEMTYLKKATPYFSGVNGKEIGTLPMYTPLQVISGPHQQSDTVSLYKVKGYNFEGYVGESHLQKGSVTFFTDMTGDDPELSAATAYLQVNDIITGYGDGTYKPHSIIKRHHVAKMLVDALNLKLPEGYQVKATDIKPTDLYYEQMAIVEAHGLMGVGGTFQPTANLSRSQMASILTRAYEGTYKSASEQRTFKDVPTSYHSYEAINQLAFNKVTTVTDYYRPTDSVSRGQFALFLTRSAQLNE
ncbi:S-layer homology domain-containing protein [Metabacillus iocasae]|uniref:SLH domain-containing protein n=1 Tax=Priestia iocasae TaxID=2291674 RepID=A0ABS2QX68_9BACI|nr:S-layer homology domain-containing protein [Metabacillus iocasae]MBM7704000.1 hypothetical protein [Metabacillus iocasae]